MVREVDHHFHHGVVLPFNELVKRRLACEFTRAHTSGLTNSVENIAKALYHLSERAGATDATLAVTLRGIVGRPKFGDIANTAKHGIRAKAAGQVTLSTAHTIETDDLNRARFLRTVLAAQCPAWGPIEVVEALEDGIRDAMRILGLRLAVEDARRTCQGEFQETLRMWLPKGELAVEGGTLQFLSRNSGGELVPTDPEEFKFEVWSAG